MAEASDFLQSDQLSSSYLVLLVLGIVLTVTGVLFKVGLIKWTIAISASIARNGIRQGFLLWQTLFSWASLPTFASIIFSTLLLGWLSSRQVPALTIVCGLIPIFMGVMACLACMFIDHERYAVSRGYQAIHNPLVGQGLAINLVRYGHAVGVPLLVTASVGMVCGFALLNFGLYQTIGHGWYSVKEGQANPTYVDFLANALIVLLRIVDVLDFANSSHLVEISYVRQVEWPSKALLTGFRTFFTVVLFQQVLTSFRRGLVLSETITDLWNPNQPIHERASHAFPQYGPGAVGPLLISLGNVTTLTKEQRDHLPLMLAGIGPAAVPALTRHLSDKHEHVRAVATAALGRLRIRATIVMLVPLCQDVSEIVRQSLTEALGVIASTSIAADESKVTVLSLRGRLWRSLKFKPKIVEASSIDPVELAVKTLQTFLKDSSIAVRAQAARALGLIGPRAAGAAVGLIELMSDDDEVVRREAIEAVGKVGGPTVAIVDALVAVLQDASPVLRAAAAKEIGVIGESAASAFPALAPLLQDREDSVRDAVAEAIGLIGHLDDDAAEELSEGLTSPDSVVRAQTAEALGAIGETAHETAPALVDALTDQNDNVRAMAVQALGKIGESVADVAVPGLVRALRDQDNIVSSLAAEALGEMGESADAAIPSLVRSLQHINADVRANAAESLGKLGAEAKSAVSALERAGGDDDAKVRSNSIQALAVIDHPKNSTKKVVLDGLVDNDAQVRTAAVDAISRWGEIDDKILNLLWPLLDDPNEQVRALVTMVLPRLTGATPAVIEQLCRRLRDDTDLVQSQAAESLGEMGTAAAVAGETLLRAAKTGELGVRDRAIRAIKSIRPSEGLATRNDGPVDPAVIVELREIENQTSQNPTEIGIEILPVIITRIVDPETSKQVEAAIMLEIAREEGVGEVE